MLDEAFHCDFVFGKDLGDIKEMDTSKLKGAVKKVDYFRWHGLSWQHGVLRMNVKPYDAFIMLGETHNLSTWLFSLRLRLLHPRKKLYYWSHGWYGKESELERFLKKVFFRLPNGGTFLYGNYARDLMIKEGFAPEKLYVIHNSLAYEKQLALRKDLHEENVYQNHFGNGNLNLFFVGRLTKVKQLDLAIKALAKCQEKGHHYNLTLIGDGEAKEELVRLTEKLGLTDSVWFYGGCYDEAELGRMIYNADLCVSPGNVGLTAMHTMVFGTPVITHNDFAHQMPEFEAIKDDETGTFFEYGSVVSLTDSIIRWLETNKNRREEIRQACYHEIDAQWTPQFQINVFKKVLNS